MEYSKPKENENESNKKLTISVLQSQKLFNKNTAFVLSINSPDKIDKDFFKKWSDILKAMRYFLMMMRMFI